MSETARLAARFAESVLGNVGNRKRVSLGELDDTFDEVAPEWRHQPGRRHRLADAIAEAASEGAWTPSVKTDRSEAPPLPAFVTVSDARTVPHAARIRDRVWRPELAWAATEPLTDSEEGQLLAVQEWLRTRPCEGASVPHRERSLQLFGDEKELDRLARGRLFGPGRLSYDLLRCVFVPPPIAQTRIRDIPTALVVENSATYATLGRYCVDRAINAVGILAYGAGRAFVQSVASLRHDLSGALERIYYFGDLDADGLAIPVGAAEAAKNAALPAPEPAVVFYELLLDVGVPMPAPRTVSDEVADELVAWLPEHLRARAAKLLVNGLRLAQEAVGYEILDERQPTIS
jgi:hypothetical protein